MKINTKTATTAQIHQYLLSAVAPRPIALVSTIDKEGNVNLSPFSFFNVFSANPPIAIFSPARRVRDNTTKHTLENVLEHPECVIHLVSYDMVEQMSLSSTEYDKGINEFTKSGFTQITSDSVKPPRVLEAPVAFECNVLEIKPLGDQGGAGNLVICEILQIHIEDSILDVDGKIDTLKIDLVSRYGGNWYGRTLSEALFEIPKPIHSTGIGIDQLPEHIKNSSILTGNNLARLANVEKLPSEEEVNNFLINHPDLKAKNRIKIHKLAKELIEKNEIEQALYTLLIKLNING